LSYRQLFNTDCVVLQSNLFNSSSFNSSTRSNRHFFVGPGRIPIFCLQFCSSICSIRHLFLSVRSVLFG